MPGQVVSMIINEENVNQFDYDSGHAWYCTMLEVGSAVFSLQPARSSAGDQLSTLVARALSEVRGVIQGEVWNVQWQCPHGVSSQDTRQDNAVHLRPWADLHRPAGSMMMSSRSIEVCSWLTFTSAMTPYEWDGGEKLRHHVFRLFYRWFKLVIEETSDSEGWKTRTLDV